MKRKRKKEGKKRSEEKKIVLKIELGPFGTPGESFTTRSRGTHKLSVEFLLLKPSSLIKHELKDIFQKNDCSLDSENPTLMHFIAFTCREWKPKLVCEQNVFCYRDVRSYVYKANYPKSLPFPLKEL